MQNDLRELKSLFPISFQFLWKDERLSRYQIQEVRIRVNQPVILQTSRGELFITQKGEIVSEFKSDEKNELFVVSEKEINAIFSYLCQESAYAYLEEMKKGFITVRGGHRVGIAGEMVPVNENEIAVKRVNYLNIRFSREIPGTANAVLPYLYEENRLLNTLLISPPGCGKTTLLRDLIKQISDGNSYGKGKKVGVVDERYELQGESLMQNHLGIRTDILSGCLKTKGIMMLLRSMSPEVIAVDEIGGEQDRKALEEATHCGCSLLATIHGDTNQNRDKNRLFLKEKGLQDQKNELFQRYIFLGKKDKPGYIFSILNEKGEELYEKSRSIS